MIYKEGVGFIVDEATQNDMARLGIGQPPRNLENERILQEQQLRQQQQMEEQRIAEQNAMLQQQQIQEQSQYNVQQQYSQPSTINENDRKKKVDEYMQRVSGSANTEAPSTETQPKPQNDFFSNWFDSPQGEVKKEENIEVPGTDVRNRDPIVEYRRGIVEESIKQGLNPEDVERTIATMTPEEQVILAKIKMEYDAEVRRKAQSPQPQAGWQQRQPVEKKPLVFNSLKSKPTPSIVSAPNADFNSKQRVDQGSVYENMIKNRFY